MISSHNSTGYSEQEHHKANDIQSLCIVYVAQCRLMNLVIGAIKLQYEQRVNMTHKHQYRMGITDCVSSSAVYNKMVFYRKATLPITFS